MISLYKSKIYLSDLSVAADSVVGIDKLKNKSILITGATGLIGSFIVDILLCCNEKANANIKIYACGRSKERLHDRFAEKESKNLEFVEYDVNTPVNFDFNADYIIHAASNAYPAAFNADPVGTINSNVIGTNNLLNYALNHGAKRFLFVSSGEVYGQCSDDVTAFVESYSGYVDPTDTRSCYPVSKRTAETLCVSFTKQFGLQTVIARPCHTYGPNTTKSDNRANVQFVNNAINGEDIVMKSAGSQMRSYCYVADCASAILTVLLCGNSGEAYNICNNNARISIAGFAKEVAESVGRKVIFENPTDADIAQQTKISYAVLDGTKLENLGFKPNYSVNRGVNNTVKALLEVK